MEKDKKFTLDEETLKAQREKVKDLIEGDKKAIAENNAIARDPNCDFNQREWAEARVKGNLGALNQHQKMYEETNERLNKLKDSSN